MSMCGRVMGICLHVFGRYNHLGYIEGLDYITHYKTTTCILFRQRLST